MSEVFEADRIESEKPDPIEGSSTRWLAVPPLLLSFFVGFGITYLWFQTDSLQFRHGDMRSPVVAGEDVIQTSDGASLAELGETVYKRNCQACHQANGQGLGAAFPPLDGSTWVTGSEERLSALILYGISGEIEVKGKTYNGAMPRFQGKLSDEELAAVATFVRGSWSNGAGPVEPSVIDKVSRRYDRNAPWNGQSEIDAQDW